MADTERNAEAGAAAAQTAQEKNADQSGSTTKPDDGFDNEFWVSDNPAGCTPR